MFLGLFLGLSIIIDLQSEVPEDFLSVVAILIHRGRSGWTGRPFTKVWAHLPEVTKGDYLLKHHLRRSNSFLPANAPVAVVLERRIQPQ